MSRTRFRTHQLEPEVRGSPLHWSDESDGDCNRDQDETDDVEQTPPRAAETEEYEAEDQNAYADSYHLRGGRSINKYRDTSRSPLLCRRPMRQHAAVTEEHRSPRATSVTYHPENSVTKFQTDRQLQEQEKTIQQSQVQVGDTISSIKCLIFIFVLLTFILIFRHLFVSPDENSHTSKGDMSEAVKTALAQFENIPGDVAIQVSAAIRSTVESDPNIPTIFLLLHNNTGSGPLCLAKAIGIVAMKYLESDEEYPLTLTPGELLKNENILEDYGWVIENYKPRIERHRSVIIKDLQKLPGKVAMAFHFLCDTYSPVVPKSLFVFTFYAPDVHSTKEVEQAEKEMHRLWKKEVNDDQRQALITRLTEGVISLPQTILHNEACP